MSKKKKWPLVETKQKKIVHWSKSEGKKNAKKKKKDKVSTSSTMKVDLSEDEDKQLQ